MDKQPGYLDVLVEAIHGVGNDMKKVATTAKDYVVSGARSMGEYYTTQMDELAQENPTRAGHIDGIVEAVTGYEADRRPTSKVYETARKAGFSLGLMGAAAALPFKSLRMAASVPFIIQAAKYVRGKVEDAYEKTVAVAEAS